MWKFMLCTFAFMGWGFYELSGGSDFQPPVTKPSIAATLTTYDVPAVAAVEPAEENVTTDTQPVAPLVAIETAVTVLETYTPQVTQPLDGNQAQPATLIDQDAKDMRTVAANRVNMRNGPSTRFQVLAKLTRGQEVEVLQIPGDGWVKLRVTESGRIGWMAERLLTAPTN